MKYSTPVPAHIDFELIDSGNGQRLERYGQYTIIRPDTTCLWQPDLAPRVWQQADASCIYAGKNRYEWRGAMLKDWVFTYQHPHLKRLTSRLRVSHSKNIGVFIEQAAHWDFYVDYFSSYPAVEKIRALNLFGYTGFASQVLAALGMQVTHVDASKSVNKWAQDNFSSNALGDTIRVITDDALTFMQREKKRGNTYDVIVLDPPAFGRAGSKVFSFDKDCTVLLNAVADILSEKPVLLVCNGYAMGHHAPTLYSLLRTTLPSTLASRHLSLGELMLFDRAERAISCSVYSRYNL